MVRSAEQDAGPVTMLAPASRVLVVTAGRGDRGDVAVRMLERLGANCALLDVSSAGRDAAQLASDVHDAYEQLAGGAPGARRIALAAVGWSAAPALAAAAALAEHSPLPGVLVVNGRFDGAPRPFAPLGGPGLLVLDRDGSRRERALEAAVARELSDAVDVEVVGSLASDGEAILRSWLTDERELVVARSAAARPVEVRAPRAQPLHRIRAMSPRRLRARRTA